MIKYRGKMGMTGVQRPEKYTKKEITQGYLRDVRTKTAFLIVCAVMLIALVVYAVKIGTSDLSYSQIINYILHPDDSWNSTVVWDIRLPHIASAIVAGAALGVAGAVMQSVLKNPMASPFTLGVSNSAAFGAALAIMLGGGTILGSMSTTYPQISNEVLVTVLAFAFSMISVSIIILLTKVMSASPETIVLSGMAITSIFTAGLSLMQYFADDNSLALIVYWQFGSLDKLSWSDTGIIAGVFFAAMLFFIYKTWDYNSMEAGDDVARGLGVDIERTRLLGLVVSAILTAVTVSFTGIIGFIGLVAPHIVKKIVGNNFRYVLIGSVLIGALVLLVSNIVATYGFPMIINTSIPVGIVTSALGGPLFLAILLSTQRRKKGC